MQLSLNALYTKVEEATVAGTGDVESAILDMSGFRGVVFSTSIAVANAGNLIKVQQGDESDLSDAADLAGTAVAATAANEVVGVDVYVPTKRYVRAVVERAASTAVGEIYAQQYGGILMPEDNTTAGTLNIELHISPAEGTA